MQKKIDKSGIKKEELSFEMKVKAGEEAAAGLVESSALAGGIGGILTMRGALKEKSGEMLGHLQNGKVLGDRSAKEPENQRLLEQIYIWGFQQKVFLNATGPSQLE